MPSDPVQAFLPTIADLGRAYRTGSLTPTDVLDTCLSRIETRDGALNAVITVTADLAREQAARAGRELAQGIDRGPLHGIPVGIKDIIEVADVPTTWASHAMAPRTPAHSAALVRHLEAAGAVCVAKTNLLEFASGALHPDFGQTNNPWNPARISGGSSGGSGAGIAAGFFAAAVGTDTGGSIRAPAAYCGIAGLKPTYGLVDLEGVYPLSSSLDHAGPMARTPACALAMLGAMTGRDMGTLQVDLEGVRFAVIEGFRHDPAVSPNVARAFDKAVALLAASGGRRLHVELPDFGCCDQALMDIFLPESTVVHEPILARHPEGYGSATRHQLELGFDTSAMAYIKANRFRDGLRDSIDALFAEVDFLVSPTVAWVAPDADLSVIDDRGTIEMRFMAPWNLTGHPALTVPCGFAEDGLPAGLQVVAARNSDARLMRVAQAWSRLMPLAATEIQLKH